MYKQLMGALERVYSPRLALRRVALSDGWPLFAASRDPLFNRHLLWDQPGDESVMLERVDVIAGAARRGQMAAVSAVVRETGEWVSLYRFIPHADDPVTLEMGVWTHSRFWRDHYTQELTRMCIDAAFRHSRVDRLVAGAALDNVASRRVLEKVGLRNTRPITRFTERGEPILAVEHSLSRADWQANSIEPAYREVPLFDGDSEVDDSPDARERTSALQAPG